MSTDGNDPLTNLQTLPSADEPGPSLRPGGDASRTVRIAGAMLLVNALFLAVEEVLLPNLPGPGGASTGPSIVPIVIDALIGASLLTGNAKYRAIAILRVVLGMFVFGGMSLAQGDYTTAVAQVMLSSSLLAMLVGEPGKLRQGLSFAGFGLLMTLQIVAVFALTGGNAATSMLVSVTRKDLDPLTSREVTGRAFRYHLTLPSDGWYLRKDEVAKKENPLADVWLTRPVEDVHVLLIAERTDANVSIDAVADNVIANAERAVTSYKLISREPIRGNEGRLVHYSGTMGTLELEWQSGLYTDGHQVVQVVTFGTREQFGAASKDLRSIIDSFRWDDSGQPQK